MSDEQRVRTDHPTGREPVAGSGLAGLFTECGDRLSVIATPNGRQWRIAVTVATAYTPKARDELAAVMARLLTRALAEDGVTWYGHEINVEVDRGQ